MKIVCVADTHGQHNQITIPKCDLFIHAGDFMCGGEPVAHYENFADWVRKIDAREKILIPGNHDVLCEQIPLRMEKVFKDFVYLVDDHFEMGDIVIFGYPYGHPYGNWAFEKSEEDILNDVDMDVSCDIFVSHCPPLGILDKAEDGCHIGSDTIRRWVYDQGATTHIFGHNHGAYGSVKIECVEFINCSQVWDCNIPRHKPFVLEAY